MLGALRAGAIGYVLKGVSAAELADILRRGRRGRGARLAGAGGAHPHEIERPARRPARRPIDDLTKREEDILRRVARGMSNREVAEELGDPGEDGQALHDLDPGEAAGPQPRRGGADRPRRLGQPLETRTGIRPASQMGAAGCGARRQILVTTEETGPRQKGRRSPCLRALQPPASASIRRGRPAVAGRSTTVLLFGSFSS